MSKCKQTSEMRNKEKNILSKITDIYIFFIIILFPLMVDQTGFFKILECKYRCFLILSVTYVVVCTIIGVYYLVRRGKKLFLKKLTASQYFAILFLIVNCLSCFLSPYFKEYNLWIGIGRGEGLVTSCLYILSFLYVSYFGVFHKKHILYFSLSSILVNVIAILQFIGFNPFNMYQNGIGTHNVSFMTTIGNVDFISAYYTMVLSVSFMAYLLMDHTKLEKGVHLLSILFGSFIFQIIDVDSGKLAFLCILVIILPFVFMNSKRLKRFLELFAVIMFATALNLFLNVEYHYDVGRIGFYFRLDYLVLLFCLVIILLLGLAFYLKRFNYDSSNKKKILQNYGVVVFSLMIFLIIILYYGSFESGFFYEVHEVLHGNFDDKFGTYRIFLWKRTIPLIKDYPLLGSGPDTFALRFMPVYAEDIARIGPFTINDTAANIYLTMFINLGVIGACNYIIFLVSNVYAGVKKGKSYSYVFLLAIICYIIQSFFNLSVVIVSPIFWVLLAVHHLCVEREREELDV